MGVHTILKKFWRNLSDINYPCVALDIDTASITIVALSGTRQKPNVDEIHTIPLPKGTLKDETIANTKQLIAAIKQGISQLKKPFKHIAIAAPGNIVIMKKIALSDNFDPKETEHYAWAEARKAFPGISNNLYLDYAIENDAILLLAARKKELDLRIAVLQACELEPTLIDVDYYCLTRAFQNWLQLKQVDTDKSSALINIDSSAMTLIVIQNNDIIYHHRQSYNGEPLMSFYQASETTLSASGLELIQSHATRLFQFYQAEHAGLKWGSLWLSGRYSIFTNLPDTLETLFESPTQVLEPNYLLGIGLAMRGLT